MTCASTIVCAVVGPTASGKSDLALELAVRLPWALGARGAGEIVSADALQLYRGMDVGTAKTPVEGRGVDAPAAAFPLKNTTITQIGADFLLESEVDRDVYRHH